MNRPRIDLGFESSTVTLNLQVAGRIGEELVRARKASSLSTGTIASRLLLSPGQIRALETGDPSIFYNAKFHAAALRKYVELLGVKTDQLDRVLIEPVVEEESDREDHSAFRRGHIAVPGRALLAAVPRPGTLAILAAAAVVTIVATALLFGSVAGDDNTVADATPGGVTSRVDPSLRQLPVMAGQVPANWAVGAVAHLSRPDGFDVAAARPIPNAGSTDPVGHVRVDQATWVFVRYRDNSTVERVLAAGQQMALADLPIYVAVGAADGTEVTIGSTTVAHEGFVEDGQLRIGSARLRELAASIP